ncbi:AAA family ATPase [Nocardiopsis eucommiae]|uniref:AAA family ATPase n=1 Tax=Nocardiopsis eucommiae TaxID=2831970 RepID=A0A975L9X8_9ACTN|nr:AAA family ATPase [Nocardiopsis eucommiae]
MLLSFRVENHRSLRDEQELILLPSEQSESGFPVPDEITPLRVTGIFGANASGKSALVKALQFMRRTMIYGSVPGFGGPRSNFGTEDDDEDRIPGSPSSWTRTPPPGPRGSPWSCCSRAYGTPTASRSTTRRSRRSGCTSRPGTAKNTSCSSGRASPSPTAIATRTRRN